MASFNATSHIPFPNVAHYFADIVDSIATHNMSIQQTGQDVAVISPFGEAQLSKGHNTLNIIITSDDANHFNRLKHELTGLIDFVARPEHLNIQWVGDRPGAVFPPDLRILTVAQISDVTPSMRRVIFKGQQLTHLATTQQIHCRLLFQPPGSRSYQWPQLDDNGRIQWPKNGRLTSRILTIRHIDAAQGLLTIDFVMHAGTGPATSWVRQAQPGDVVGVLGPAAQGLKSADYYLLAGDETGLPGIARILEALPTEAQGVALIEVNGTDDEQALLKPAGIELRWLHRAPAAAGTTTCLESALKTVPLPTTATSRILAWVGTEYHAFKRIRHYLRQDLNLPTDQVIAFSHWRHGMSEEDIVKVGASAISA